MSWTAKQNYPAIRAALEAGDWARMKELFRTDTESEPGMPERPSLIPLGRIVVTLDGELERVELKLEDGLLSVSFRDGGDDLEVRISMKEKGVFAFRSSRIQSIRAVPSYDLAPVLKEISFAEPVREENGFIQAMPADPSYALHFDRREEGEFWLGAELWRPRRRSVLSLPPRRSRRRGAAARLDGSGTGEPGILEELLGTDTLSPLRQCGGGGELLSGTFPLPVDDRARRGARRFAGALDRGS